MLAKRNPYRTAEEHPFIRTAFNLGMLGLAKLAEKGYGTDHDGSQYRRAISSMCRFAIFYPDISKRSRVLNLLTLSFLVGKLNFILSNYKNNKEYHEKVLPKNPRFYVKGHKDSRIIAKSIYMSIITASWGKHL